MKLNRIKAKINNAMHYRHPESFDAELEHQCQIFLVPSAFFAILGWIPFIFLDQIIFPKHPIFVYLRLGLTLVGLIVGAFHFFHHGKDEKVSLFDRRKNYILAFCLAAYLYLSGAIIVGIGAAHPAYVGGLCILIVFLPLFPFRPRHSFLLLASCLLLFGLMAYDAHVKFTPSVIYSLVNLGMTVPVAIVGTGLLHFLRRRNYRQSLEFQKNYEYNLKHFYQHYSISPREQEIIELILDGRSNQQIEKMLFISIKTVKTHIYNIYKKLAVKNRTQLLQLMDKVKKSSRPYPIHSA